MALFGAVPLLSLSDGWQWHAEGAGGSFHPAVSCVLLQPGFQVGGQFITLSAAFMQIAV